MKRLWPLVALGIGAYLVFAFWTLPASVVMSQVANESLYADGVSGTIWNGRIEVLSVGGVPVGRVEWKLRKLPLLIGHASADLSVAHRDGSARGLFTVRRGAYDFERLNAALPLSALPPTMVPGGWLGNITLKLDSLTLEKGWPTRAAGTVDLLDLTGPANRPVNMGSYRVTLPLPGAKAEAGTLTGALADLNGPLQINGSLQLKPDRTYVIEGNIATRSDAPADVVKAIQYLGAPDAQGLRPFSIAGSL